MKGARSSFGTRPICIERKGSSIAHIIELSQLLCIHNYTHAASPRFLGKEDNSMMRAIPEPFLSMQREQVPRLCQKFIES